MICFFIFTLYFHRMAKTLIYLLLSFAGCLAQAQALQLEAFISGGANLSQGQAAEGFWQPPFPTFYAQGNLGYWVSDRWGAGAGLTYFPIGISRRFFPHEARELGMPFFSAKSSSTTYRFMPHLYAWYIFSEHAQVLAASQLSMGILYAKWPHDFWSGRLSEVELINGQILYRQTETVVGPHIFLAIEARWDVRLWHSPRHGLFGVLHVIKGINPIRTTTDAYVTGTPNFEDQSIWVTRGDYLGIGVAYKWKWWKFR